MISTTGLGPIGGRLHERAHLHRIQARLDHAEPDATRAEHRVELLPQPGRVVELLLLIGETDGGRFDRELVGGRQELVQRRVEQPDRHRQPVHGFEDLDEVCLLHLAQRLERGRLFLRRLGEDHALHDRQPVAEEHVLGAAQADALGAEVARVLGVGAVVGVGPHRELALADLVGPPQHLIELRRRRAGAELDLAEHDLAGGAVDREDIALAHAHVPHCKAVAADPDLLGADDRRLAPPAGDDRSVAHQPAPRGEDALGDGHAVHVVG